MDVFIKTFMELDVDELYDILKLRSEVFVVEQTCVYQDIDGKDKEALHVIGKEEGHIVAYTRCFAPGIYFNEAAIGRVVVDSNKRKHRYGHQIMEESINAVKSRFNTHLIKLSAQTHLKEFYTSHGFKPTGKEYLEDGIPHIAMVTAL